jgi:hypothetical protein
MRWKLRGPTHQRSVRMVHDGGLVDCPASRRAADVSTDDCLTCPVFEHLVDDETLAYVVCGRSTTAAVDDRGPAAAGGG